MIDLALSIDEQAVASLGLNASASSLLNNIYLSLMIPLGSWWFNPSFGSRLHLLRHAPLAPVVVPARRHRQHPAHQSHRELALVIPHRCVLHFGCFAKYAAAFFRNAFSSSTRASSRRSRANSDCCSRCASSL